jgi:hypothetical protein
VLAQNLNPDHSPVSPAQLRHHQVPQTDMQVKPCLSQVRQLYCSDVESHRRLMCTDSTPCAAPGVRTVWHKPHCQSVLGCKKQSLHGPATNLEGHVTHNLAPFSQNMAINYSCHVEGTARAWCARAPSQPKALTLQRRGSELRDNTACKCKLRSRQLLQRMRHRQHLSQHEA